MELSSFRYESSKGWSVAEFPKLDSDSTLVLVFGASGLRTNTQVFDELKSAFPTSTIRGCSTSGEIHQERISDESLSVAVARFAKTKLKSAVAPVESSEQSFDCGVELAKQLQGSDLRGVLVLSDGLQVNGSELVRGINSVLPSEVVVTGGLAGDGERFESTWILHDTAPVSGQVAAVGLYGSNVHIGHGSKGGWDRFGPEREVTKATANVLYELDGKPALELYKHYLGERASGLPATGLLFPLAIREQNDAEKSLVRTILSVDEATQSLTFAGDIPVGSRAQLMRANFDRLVDGAAEAAIRAKVEDAQQSPTLAVAISCVGRRLVLGERTEEEVEATLDVLPEGTQQVGFYSYGEISPFATGNCDLHNQTMTLTTIRET